MATKKSKSSRQFNIKKYAPISLWISGVALLAGVILLLVKLISAMGLLTIANRNLFNWGLYICLAVLIIGLAVFALIDPGRVRSFLTGRQARYGSNSFILLIAFIGILIVINIIVYQNPFQMDFTEDKQHTLAPETISTLKALPSKVEAFAFYTVNSSQTDAQKLLQDIKTASNGKFDYQFVDPEANPAKAQQYQVTRDATIVLVLGSQKESITSASEQELTNALVRLMNPGQRSIYFLIGHGEGDIQASGQESYTQVQSVLTSKNYDVKTLNLRAQNQVPADAKAVVIAGPTQVIPAEEISLLQDYLAKGGALIVLEKPSVLMEPSTTPDPLLDFLNKDWGITLNNDLVIDPNITPPIIAVADTKNYASHPIMDQLQNKTLIFPYARSLVVSTVANVTSTELVKTIDNAWGESDFTALQNNQIIFDPSKDFKGPLTIGVAAENSSNKSRLVVFGDADFANDTSFSQYANSDLIINSIDWAAGQESMINLTTKAPITRSMNLISSPLRVALTITFVFVLPALILAGGIISWLMRRSRG